MVTASLVIFASLIVGYFIVSAETPSFLQSVASMREERPSSDRRLNKPALGGKLPRGEFKPVALVEDVKALQDRAYSINLTESVLDGFFGDPNLGAELRNVNLNDPSGMAMLRRAVETRIDGAQSGFGNIFSVNITDDEIKISTDNSDGAKREYLRAIANANLKIQSLAMQFQFGMVSMNPESFCAPGGEPSSLAGFTLDIKNALASISEIRVPSDWKEVHRLMLKYSKQSSLIYEGLLGCGIDPIKTMLAGNALGALAETGNALRLALNQKAKEVGYDGKF